MKLMKVRLALGRTREAPEGDPDHGYEFIAPLDAKGHIDAAAWASQRDRCTVRCFRPGNDDKKGYLRHVGQGWRFDYDPVRKDDDESIFKLDKHVIAPGLYVTITEENGAQLPFRILNVSPLKVAA